MAPTYVISVATAGDKAIAGPLVAAALVLDARIANPRFVWTGARGRRPQLLADFDNIPHDRRQQIVKWLRPKATGTGIITCTARQLNTVDNRELRRQALGRAVMRAVEHAIFCHPSIRLAEKTTRIVVSGADPISAEYVRGAQQFGYLERNGRPWQLDAAYVIARSHRDGLMRDAHAEHPAYDFAQNNGYASAQHRWALEEQGLTPYHRHHSLLVREVRRSV